MSDNEFDIDSSAITALLFTPCIGLIICWILLLGTLHPSI